MNKSLILKLENNILVMFDFDPMIKGPISVEFPNINLELVYYNIVWLFEGFLLANVKFYFYICQKMIG